MSNIKLRYRIADWFSEWHFFVWFPLAIVGISVVVVWVLGALGVDSNDQKQLREQRRFNDLMEKRLQPCPCAEKPQ